MPYPLPPRILLLQTDSTRYLEHTARRLKQRRLFPNAELIVVCSPQEKPAAEAIPEVNQVQCVPSGGVVNLFRFWRKLSHLEPDLVCGVFSGRPGHWREKVIFLGLPAPRRLAFNASLDCYQVSLATFFRMGRREPLLFDEQITSLAERASQSLLIQTADNRSALEALRKLRDPSVTRPGPLSVLCPEDQRPVFERFPGVIAVHGYQPGKHWDFVKSMWKLSRLHLDLVAAIFTGERGFLAQKLMFLTLPARNRLVFNPNLDCFRLNRWNVLQVAKLATFRDPRKRCLLLIQTAGDSETLKAVAKLRDPRVARPAPLVVFCRKDKKPLFEPLEGVRQIFTYEPGKPWQAIKTVKSLLELDIEVAAALFTEEPIFRWQKLLFVLLPARNHLTFNRNLDCYYLKRSNFWSLMKRARREEPSLPWLPSLLRPLAKGVLFLPRFLYLVIWITGQKLKRAYTLSSVVK